MASVLDGSNEYRDAIYILEDAVSDQWKYVPVVFPPDSTQYFLVNEIAHLRSPNVLFLHTGKCKLVRNVEKVFAHSQDKDYNLILDGINITLDSLILQLATPFDNKPEYENLFTSDSQPYIIIFLIIDKNADEISNTIKSTLNDLNNNRRPFHVVTLPINEEESLTEEEYEDSIPLVIRDFAEAFFSNHTSEENHTKLDNILDLFVGAKLYTSKLHIDYGFEEYTDFSGGIDGDSEDGEKAVNDYQNMREEVEIFPGGKIELATSNHTYSKSGNIYNVWFGTDRSPINTNDISQGFSNERDNKINYGICQVKIPKSHKIGDGQPSFWKRLFGAEKMTLETINGLDKNSFWESIKSAIQLLPTDDQTATIFIHGYNNSFEKAAIQTAQMLSDLNTPGIFAFYSWPSQGTFGGYVADSSTILESFRYISQFINEFSQTVNAEKINIIAHSMGNRGVLDAFDQVLKNIFIENGKKINQIILAAPDVDAYVFRSRYNAYTSTALRTTLYVSDKDRALQASRILNQVNRIGLTPPISIFPGIDTVFVSDIDLSLLGHGYVANNRVVLTDMHQLLLNNSAPAQRIGLKSVQTVQNGIYYEIQK